MMRSHKNLSGVKCCKRQVCQNSCRSMMAQHGVKTIPNPISPATPSACCHVTMQGSAELAREYLAWVGPQANQYLSLGNLCLIGGFGRAVSVSNLYVCLCNASALKHDFFVFMMCENQSHIEGAWTGRAKFSKAW